jgi:hypothetical protein
MRDAIVETRRLLISYEPSGASLQKFSHILGVNKFQFIT